MQTKEVSSKKFDALMAKSIDLKKCPRCASFSAEITIPMGCYGSRIHKVRIKCTNCGFELKGHSISASIVDTENKRYGNPIIEKSFLLKGCRELKMENLNAEQVKKALEKVEDTYISLYKGTDGLWHEVRYSHILALINSQEQRIKELTEENVRLRAEVNKLDALSDEMGVDIDVKLKTIFELEDKLKAEKADVMYFKDQIRADTVRKMQERLVERFKTDTYSKYSGAGVVMVIDQITNELLEGG